METPVSAASEIAISALRDKAPQALELATHFKKGGFTLALVGGSVRDILLNRLGNDLDFTTNARPDDIKKIMKSWASEIWEIGAKFGTIGAKRGDLVFEITTYRSEVYVSDSRKPEVKFGDSIEVDLYRRDFTVNAMAIELTTEPPTFIDPHNGVRDLLVKSLRTPGAPELSFGDDPLRMLRAARFAAQLGFAIAPEVLTAMSEMASRLEIVSAERVHDEFVKIMMSPNPRIGITTLVDSGLCEKFLPEIPKLRLEIDEHHHHKDVYEHTLTVVEQSMALEERLGGPNLVIRLAALLHDIGKPKTRALIDGGGVSFHHHEVVGARMTKERLKKLRFEHQVVEDVAQLVFLHLRFHGYGGGEWSDSAVRRYVRDAGDLLTHLHVLTRADCTTRNKKKAESLASNYDHLEARIAALMEEEELLKIRPDLDGHAIMEILGVKAGPIVGKAYEFLLELRLEHGPLGEERAKEELLNWWAKNQS
ncbi:MAG: CCA tRNA nucleotidyltransferase [Candidatus Nanopelagicaceae bacterium]|nr:CCA tRNA nucleotidyltransferase [Candidatus Nanopelagicaceae bacterium]